MSEYRGIAGCPNCKVPWAVADWTTYLSVACPTCGRKLGEVANGRQPPQILGQQPPVGVPAALSALVTFPDLSAMGRADALKDVRDGACVTCLGTGRRSYPADWQEHRASTGHWPLMATLRVKGG